MTRRSNSVAFVTAGVVLAISCSSAAEQAQDEALEATLAASDTYFQGAPMLIAVEIRNIGQKAISLGDYSEPFPMRLERYWDPIPCSCTIVSTDHTNRFVLVPPLVRLRDDARGYRGFRLSSGARVRMLVDVGDLVLGERSPPPLLPQGEYTLVLNFKNRGYSARSNAVRIGVRRMSAPDDAALSALRESSKKCHGGQDDWEHSRWYERLCNSNRDFAILGGLSPELAKLISPYLLFVEVGLSRKLSDVTYTHIDTLDSTYLRPEAWFWRYEVLMARGDKEEGGREREVLEKQFPGLAWRLGEHDAGDGYLGSMLGHSRRWSERVKEEEEGRRQREQAERREHEKQQQTPGLKATIVAAPRYHMAPGGCFLGGPMPVAFEIANTGAEAIRFAHPDGPFPPPVGSYRDPVCCILESADGASSFFLKSRQARGERTADCPVDLLPAGGSIRILIDVADLVRDRTRSDPLPIRLLEGDYLLRIDFADGEHYAMSNTVRIRIVEMSLSDQNGMSVLRESVKRTDQYLDRARICWDHLTWRDRLRKAEYDISALAGLSVELRQLLAPYLLLREVGLSEKLADVGFAQTDLLDGTFLAPESSLWRYELLMAKGKQEEAREIRRRIENEWPGLRWSLKEFDEGKGYLGRIVGTERRPELRQRGDQEKWDEDSQRPRGSEGGEGSTEPGSAGAKEARPAEAPIGKKGPHGDEAEPDRVGAKAVGDRPPADGVSGSRSRLWIIVPATAALILLAALLAGIRARTRRKSAGSREPVA